MTMNFIANRVQVGQKGRLDVGGLRELALNDPENFLMKTREIIDDGKFSWNTVQRGDRLYEALNDVPVKVIMETAGGGQRAITSAAFPVLAGDLTARALQDKYDSIPTIGQELVEELQDKQKSTMLSAVEVINTADGRHKQGDEFDKIGASERTVVIGHQPRGYMFDITAETMEENQLSDITSRINKLAQIVSDEVEEITIDGVTDQDSVVYRPNGTAEALYASTDRDRTGSSGNLVTTNAFVDESDVNAALKQLWAMVDERGKPINMPTEGMICLVPSTLYITAWQQFNSVMKTAAATTHTKNILNDKGGWGAIRMISSVLLDAKDDAVWYLGHFKKQFVRKWKLQMEYVTAGMDDNLYLRNRIAFQARIAYDVEIGATDYVWVVKNTT